MTDAGRNRDGHRDIDRKVAAWMGEDLAQRCGSCEYLSREGSCTWGFVCEHIPYLHGAEPKPYTTDANLAREVLAEVERRGLADDWMKELETILDVWDWKRDERFMLVTASPLDQMRALVRVIKGEGDG